ncbi:MAG: hypothetical protein AAFO91_01395, partial [Bacteroidota bacterium]
TRFTTGKDHDKKGQVVGDWLKEVRPKESETELGSRKAIYKPATKTACRSVRTFYSKVFRVDGIQHKIEGDRNKEEVEAAVSNFHGGESLFSYLKREQVNHEFSDPNAYLIILKEQFEDERGGVDEIIPYPVIIPSNEVIRQKHHRGLPLWIVRKQELLHESSGKKYKEYTLYAAGIVVVYRQLIPEMPTSIGEKRTIDKEDYDAQFFLDTGSTEFPGIQLGAYKAENGKHKVSALDPASDVLMELVNKKSILDVAYDNHVRPHRYEFDMDCGSCEGGFVSQPDDNGEYIDKECGLCDGTGRRAPKTEANVTRVALPDYDDGREVFKLADLYHYETVDLATIQELDQKVNSLILAVPYAVFSSQMEVTPVVASTATEHLLKAENINNAVYPFAEHCSRIMKTVTRVIAQYMDADIEVSHQFPENLKLENLSDLIARLSAAKQAGADQEAIFAINCEITEKTNAGSPLVVANLKAFEQHKPFRSMPDGVVAAILMDRANNDPDRLIYENYDRIRTTLTNRNEQFYAIGFDRQAELIRTEAQSIYESSVYAQSIEPELSLV